MARRTEHGTGITVSTHSGVGKRADQTGGLHRGSGSVDPRLSVSRNNGNPAGKSARAALAQRTPRNVACVFQRLCRRIDVRTFHTITLSRGTRARNTTRCVYAGTATIVTVGRDNRQHG